MLNRVISHYRIIEEVGRGGMGIVYRAEDIRLHRHVALKFLSASADDDPQARARFLHEARVAAALNHPSLAIVHQIDEVDGMLFIAMEFVEGSTLEAVVRTGPIAESQVRDIARQTAEGLRSAHEKGVVHRDFKSANVMLTPQGRVKIMDLGLAKSTSPGAITQTGARMGTLLYMSPEQARGEDVDQRSDIWSWGVVLYEMLAGRPPFRSDYDQALVYSILNEPPPALSRSHLHHSGMWQRIVLRCLEKEASDRYQNMGEVLADLGLLSDSTPAPEGQRSASTGTATFLFSDIEGSTRLLQRLGDRYADVLAQQRELLRSAFAAYGGREVDTAGDGFFAVFDRARQAVAAAVEAQHSVNRHAWPGDVEVRVRMGIHTGEPITTATGFVGLDVHRAARICSAGHGGQVLLSQSTQALVANDLPTGVTLRDLGDHRLKDLLHAERIFQIVVEGLAHVFPPLHGEAEKRANLPSQAGPLIGRDREIRSLTELLMRDDVRLITLTGPGGTGKTRLSVKVASELVEKFSDGVSFVPLAQITDPALVLPTIAHALGVKEAGGRPIDAVLKEYLRSRSHLLLLDNFEQIVDAAPAVGDLLEACSRVKILVTSRFVLRLSGEQEFPVPPLSLPDTKRLPPAASLSQYASVELFIQRARAVKPEFSVTNENAPAVAEICFRLDGLPLAIELAAARIKLFSPQSMLSRLQSRLELLKGGARDRPSRHQTLRHAIGWSYDLLSPDEQRLFRRLAIFVGGSTLDAIEATCPVQNDFGIDVLDGVAALVDKSLLRQDESAGGAVRFAMLETIREYALEKLADSGDRETIARTHAAFFLGLAEQAEPNLTGPQQAVWLDRLEADHGNLRAALRWLEESGDIAGALRLGGALWRFWIVRGHMIEGHERLKHLLDLPGAAGPTLSRAKVLNGAGTIAHEVSEHKYASALFAESLRIFRETGDERGVATVLNNLGWVSAMLCDFNEARRYSEESRLLHEKLGDQRGVALALNNLGWVSAFLCDFEESIRMHRRSLALRELQGDKRGEAFAKVNIAWVEGLRGNYEGAMPLIQDAREELQRLGDRQLTAWAICVLGLATHAQGHSERSRMLFEESTSLMREVGNQWAVAFEGGWCGHVAHDMGDRSRALDMITGGLERFREQQSPWGVAMMSAFLGHFRYDSGDLNAAKALYLDSLLLRYQLKDKRGIAECLESLGCLALQDKEVQRAGLLLGAAETLRHSIGAPLFACETARINPVLLSLREQSGEETLAEGRRLTLDRAITAALEGAVPDAVPLAARR